jgi:hypothetical protein
VLRRATRSSIQFRTSAASHAILQAPSRTRLGNWPAASRRAIWAKLYGTAKTIFNSFFETSFYVIGHSLRKGSIAMLARNQLAGTGEHTGKCDPLQPNMDEHPFRHCARSDTRRASQAATASRISSR